MSWNYNTVICQQKREEEISYEMLWSYQGEWVLFTYANGKYFFREGGYGSCSWCDNYESTFNYDEPVIDSKKTIDFVEEYKPSKEFTGKELKQFATSNELLYGFIPVSTHSYHEEDYDKAIIEWLKACLAHYEKTDIEKDIQKVYSIFTLNVGDKFTLAQVREAWCKIEVDTDDGEIILIWPNGKDLYNIQQSNTLIDGELAYDILLVFLN